MWALPEGGGEAVDQALSWFEGVWCDLRRHWWLCVWRLVRASWNGKEEVMEVVQEPVGPGGWTVSFSDRGVSAAENDKLAN